MRLFISGYGDEKNPSVNLYDIDMDTKSVTSLYSTKVKNASYLRVSDDRMFCISESGESSIHMYRWMDDGYKKVDSKQVVGKGLCHITYLEKHNVLVGSCYGDGKLFSIRVTEEGFSEYASIKQLNYNDDNISRAHCAMSDKEQKLLFVTNIASDTLYQYEVCDGILTEKATINLGLGEGPRHIYIDNTKKMVYVITEYSNMIIRVSYADGLSLLGSISTLPDGFDGKSYCSTLAVTKDSKYMYGANRGDDSIAMYRIDDNGGLTLLGHVGCGGVWPRDIALVDDDRYLCVANERSDKAVLIARKDDGRLMDVELEIPFPKPSCVVEK